MLCVLSLKRLTFYKTCRDRYKCKCLGKWTGARTWRSNGTAKRGWYVANSLFVSCGFNPSTSLHTVRNLCLRSPVNSWIEMEVPCHTACINKSHRRNPWKASRTLEKHLIPKKEKAVQHEGSRECMLRSTFSTLLNVSMFDMSMLLTWQQTWITKNAVARTHTPSRQPS